MMYRVTERFFPLGERQLKVGREGHVEAELVVAHVAPAAVALAQLRLLRDGGHGEGQLRRIEIAAGRLEDVLHLRDHRRRLAVRFLVVDAAVELDMSSVIESYFVIFDDLNRLLIERPKFRTL